MNYYKFNFSISVLGFFALGFSLTAFANDSWRTSCILLLRQFAYYSNEAREQSAKEFWTLYKNDDRFFTWLKSKNSLKGMSLEEILKAFHSSPASSDPAIYKPKTVDFDEKCITADCPLQNSDDGISQLIPFRPSIYETRLMELRKGDTLKIGDKKFVLGEFLGAGNSVHIFALDDNTVIRIPMPVRAFDFFGLGKPSGVPVQKALSHEYESVHNYIQLANKIKAPHVRVLEPIDPLNRYILVSRVHGDENGKDFLRKIMRPYFQNFEEAMYKEGSITPGRYDRGGEILDAIKARYGTDLRKVPKEQLFRFATSEFYKSVHSRLNPEDQKKLDKLLEFDTNLGTLPFVLPEIDERGQLGEYVLIFNDLSDQQANGFEALRQVVFDKRQNNWIIVDWDEADIYFHQPGNGSSLLRSYARMHEEEVEYEP